MAKPYMVDYVGVIESHRVYAQGEHMRYVLMILALVFGMKVLDSEPTAAQTDFSVSFYWPPFLTEGFPPPATLYSAFYVSQGGDFTFDFSGAFGGDQLGFAVYQNSTGLGYTPLVGEPPYGPLYMYPDGSLIFPHPFVLGLASGKYTVHAGIAESRFFDNFWPCDSFEEPCGMTVRVTSPTGLASPVPEPSSLVLLGTGLIGIGLLFRKREEEE